MKRVFRRMAVGLGILCLLAAAHPAVQGQNVSPVPKLDLNEFTGTWFEVARYPTKWEKRCVGDVMDLFAEGNKPNHLQLVKTCQTKAGYTDERNGNARAQDKSGDGKLKLSYVWPFSTKFWVLALGPKYAWALVGSPNHKNLWVLSRTTHMQPGVLAEIEAKAAAAGFSPAKLLVTQ